MRKDELPLDRDFLHESLNTCTVRDAPPARTGELLGIWRGQQFPFFFFEMLDKSVPRFSQVPSFSSENTIKSN